MKAYEVQNSQVKSQDLANLFNVYADEHRLPQNYLTYGINRTVFFKDLDLASSALFDEYYIREGDQWPLISYAYYNSVDLWWLICKINNISNPVIPPKEDTVIKLLKPQHVKSVLASIRNLR